MSWMAERPEERPAMLDNDDGTWKFVLERDHKPTIPYATVVANREILKGIACDTNLLSQIANATTLPGVTWKDVAINPDAHLGYGVPIGSVIRTKDIIIPGSVGYDIQCSMSLLQTDVPKEELVDVRVRRLLLDAIEKRVPTGIGQRGTQQNRIYDASSWIPDGFDKMFCEMFNVPVSWMDRCEDSVHRGTCGYDSLKSRLQYYFAKDDRVLQKLSQLGTYGSGNHFGEGGIIDVADPTTAGEWGLKQGCFAFMSHCGSRGFGHMIATHHFRKLQAHFDTWRIPLSDRELVYIPVGTNECNDYLNDIALAGNFATLNHMIINKLVAESIKEIFPGSSSDLVYYISHNFVRKEYDGKDGWYVHRKGATRALPSKHHALLDTPFYKTGHPILLPGNAIDGSVIMKANDGAKKTFFSVNHGAGRCMSRGDAKRKLLQHEVDADMEEGNVISNCRTYPIDEAPGAYKDFNQVVASVVGADLATTVATMKPIMVLKSKD